MPVASTGAVALVGRKHAGPEDRVAENFVFGLGAGLHQPAEAVGILDGLDRVVALAEAGRRSGCRDIPG